MPVPKGNVFRKDTLSPPDKGDLGDFFHETFLLDNTFKPFIRRAVAIWVSLKTEEKP